MIKTFSNELAPVYCQIFNDSLSSHQVPDSWKAAIICPVPKKSNPSTLNDFRPIALTSVLMKSIERLILKKLKIETAKEVDPLQFAHNRG